jgi:glycosyltransferase involved in cell wall biosynthesis
LAVFAIAGYEPPGQAGQFTPSQSLPATIHYAGAAEYGRVSGLRKLANLLWLGGRRTLQWLNPQKSRPHAVIAYSPVLSHWRRLRRWTRAHGIPLIADLADWYSPQQMQGGRLGPPYWAQQYTYRRQLLGADGVLGISSYVCDYYKQRGLWTLKVPPLVDVQSLACRPEPMRADGPVRLVYAGFPDRKDLLGVVLEAMRLVDPDCAGFEIDIVGPQPQYVMKLWPLASRPNVRVHGRMPHEQAMRYIREADFSVLVRPDELYARAGFPTKVVESLGLGTPVVANEVGDLGEYLEDGTSAVIATAPTALSFAAALKRCANMRTRWPEMRKAARKCAERRFDFRAYADSIVRFIRQAAERSRPG